MRKEGGRNTGNVNTVSVQMDGNLPGRIGHSTNKI